MSDMQLAVRAIIKRRDRMVSALALFRPLPRQEEFFRRMAKGGVLECAVTGMNRGGKSICVAVWFASLVLGVPVTMRNGDKLHMRPEHWFKEELLCWVVGCDWKHIGETIYRLLFTSRHKLRMIKDKGEWIAYDATNPDHKARVRETKPMPPLIERSQWVPESESWESRKDCQLRSVQLLNGTRLVFYASTGQVAAGNAVHAIWIDEKIEIDSHYPEWQMRVSDESGMIVWSSWPAIDASENFMALLDRAEEEADKNPESPRAVNFRFRRGDNPFTENDAKDYFLGTMSEEEAAARGDGISNAASRLMYMKFSPVVHRALGLDPENDDALARAIRETGGIPHDWTRYMFLDPGSAHPAVLKIAIPPPSFGQTEDAIRLGISESAFVVPYGEYYPPNKDAFELAALVAADSKGEIFEDFTADWHAFRTTPMGFGMTVEEQYVAAWRKNRLECQRHGSNFSLGSDNVQVRIRLLSGLMNVIPIFGPNDAKIGPKGASIVMSARLRIHNCPILMHQLQKYRRAIDANKNPTDDPAKHQNIDLAVNLEYAAAKPDMKYVAGRYQPRKLTDLTTLVKGAMKQFGVRQSSRDDSVYCGAGRPSV